MNKIEREKKTVYLMIRLYCRHQHLQKRSEPLCSDCLELVNFAHKRTDKCPFGEEKPNCSHCRVHCYKGEKNKQAEIKKVMRYSGPRMLLYHPYLALRHLFHLFS